MNRLYFFISVMFLSNTVFSGDIKFVYANAYMENGDIHKIEISTVIAHMNGKFNRLPADKIASVDVIGPGKKRILAPHVKIKFSNGKEWIGDLQASTLIMNIYNPYTEELNLARGCWKNASMEECKKREKLIEGRIVRLEFL